MPDRLPVPENASRIAVAVSGGADSMALVHMLALHHPDIHALTVDHGLRPESALESAQVGSWLSSFSNIRHTTLRWDGEKPVSGVMAAARNARYALMADYCRDNGIRYLALGHHRDDQAETFLMRLTHASGIDGLAAMRQVQPYDDHVSLWRPLLDRATHDDLTAYCRDNGMPWIEDPTNSSTKYKRNRLRAAHGILVEEGLSAKRLSATAKRLERASDALRILASRLLEDARRDIRADSWDLDLTLLRREPFELVVRVMRMAIDALGVGNTVYGARFEKIESLTQAMLDARGPGAWTLGGCVVRVDPGRNRLSVTRENPQKSAKSLPLTANGL